MRRLLFKCALLFLFAIGPVLVINAMYVHTNRWKYENHMDRFSDIPYNLELGNVGSSHACYGIDWSNVPEIRAWNLALSAQPYFYDYAVLRKYIDHFADNAAIVICLSYREIDQVLDCTPYRARYYRILSRNEMDFWSPKECIWYRLLPVLSAGQNALRIFNDFSPERLSPYFNRDTYLDGEELYNYCIKKHKEWTRCDDKITPKGYTQNLDKVVEIIELCHAHRLRPVLITMPVTDVLNNIYKEKTPEFLTTFRQFSADLHERYPDVPYFDYSHDKIFSSHHEFFYDGDHLNNKGAALFTKTLVADLRLAGILEQNVSYFMNAAQ